RGVAPQGRAPAPPVRARRAHPRARLRASRRRRILRAPGPGDRSRQPLSRLVVGVGETPAPARSYAGWTRSFAKAGTVDIEFAVEGIGGPTRTAPAMDHIH